MLFSFFPFLVRGVSGWVVKLEMETSFFFASFFYLLILVLRINKLQLGKKEESGGGGTARFQ